MKQEGSGRAGKSAATVELVGGRLCLDFANTVEPRRGENPSDHLADYGDLMTWALRAGVLDPELARRLSGVARRRPGEVEASLARALALRETVYRLFAAVSAGEVPSGDELESLADAHTEAARHSRLVPAAGGFAWAWRDGEDPDLVAWEVARSAAELLTSGELARVKQCPHEEGGCGWLFYDESKNRSRRWCSMGDCGSRVKMRRLYARQRGRVRPEG